MIATTTTTTKRAVLLLKQPKIYFLSNNKILRLNQVLKTGIYKCFERWLTKGLFSDKTVTKRVNKILLLCTSLILSSKLLNKTLYKL